MKLFFELAGYDPFHRELWERRLAKLGSVAKADVRLVGSADESDAIIETISRHTLAGGRVFSVAQESHYHREPERTFTWDAGDQPTGRLPGLYCSLPSYLLNPARHRSFCFPLRCNPMIEPFPSSEARRLCGFVGGMTTGLRLRLLKELRISFSEDQAIVEVSNGIWGRIYGGGAEAEFARYAEALRKTKFFLCPRGNGVSSVRLFETMAAARVPVIIADRFVPPQCVDWNRCSVRIQERDLARLPVLLKEREPEWEQLAANARQAWEQCFSDLTLLKTFTRELKVLVNIRKRPESQQQWLFPLHVMPAHLAYQAGRAVRWAQSSWSRMKGHG